jgi:hypothetical protein
MEVSAQEFSELLDALRDRGIAVPDEVEDCRGLIIAVKAGGGSRQRAVVPLRPVVLEVLTAYLLRLERFHRLLAARPDLVRAVGWLTEYPVPIPYVKPEFAVQVELAELVEGFGDGKDLKEMLDETHSLEAATKE